MTMAAPTPDAEPHSSEFQNAHHCRCYSEETLGFASGKMRNVVWRDQDVMMVDPKTERTQHRDCKKGESEALIRREYKKRSQDRSRDNNQIGKNSLPSVQIDTKFAVSRVVPKKDRGVDGYEYDCKPPHIGNRVT